ncbi:metallophosphoesterase family protein [Myroides sp. LJL119]
MALKILHTADWHLGKRLDNFNRLEEQKHVLNEIIDIADKQQVDVVIIAGDLFDTFNPGVEAVELFYKTLKRLSNNGKRPVIAIAGNHDSPERIDAPDPLAKECGIIFIGLPKAKVPCFKLDNAFEITKSDYGFIEIKLDSHETPLRIIHTAYANEIRLAKALDIKDKSAALSAALQENWNELAQKYMDNKGVNLLVTHLYMLKKGAPVMEEPDGEKPLKLGNADLIYSDIIPENVQYTALGHLHKTWNVSQGNSPVVYSGSPLSYSFSEAGQKKHVVLIQAMAGQTVDYTHIELRSGRSLSRVKFDEIDLAIQWLVENPYHLVELTIVSQEFLKAEDIRRIYQAHDGIITIIPEVNIKNNSDKSLISNPVNLDQNIQDLFKDYFKQKYHGQLPNEQLMDLFNEILN